MNSPGSAQFGELLRRHRVAAGWTQDALAEAAGLSQRGVQDIERGVRRVPHAETVRRLAEALGLTELQRRAFVAAARSKPERGERDPGAVRQSNLPAPISSFIGRELDQTEIRRLLGSSRLVTLTGSGGIGKTRLAIRVASDAVASYPDGVRFVELASMTDARLIAQRVATVLGISERGAVTPLAALSEVIGRRQMLLLLDNCEHLVEAAAELVAALLQDCPRMRVLATSREPLGITGEHIWPVAPLSLLDDADAAPSEAVRLFVERATAAAPDFGLDSQNRRAVADVCRRLDGIPLAIELAAARVRTLTPTQLFNRLDNRFQLLVGGSRTAPARQQTLHATLTWSYELLSASDQQVFEQLAVFRGGWDLEAAEHVCASESAAAWDVLNRLERLVDRSLVDCQHGRYWLLETAREYAREQLVAKGAERTIRERHAAYYLHLAEAAAPQLKRSDQAAWFARLSNEHDNLRGVLQWSLDACRPDTGLRVATALQRFWEVRGYWSEARQWLNELLRAHGTPEQSVALRAAALADAGRFAWFLGDRVTSRPLLEQAVELARSCGAHATLAFALHGLAEQRLTVDRAAARRLLEASLAVARQVDDGWAIARVLSNLSSAMHNDGDLESARALAEEGLAVAHQAGERRIESTLLINLAVLHVDDPSVARAYLEDALATKRELGDRLGAARAYRGLGWVDFDRGNYATASRSFCEALSITRDLFVPQLPGPDRPTALAGLACVAFELGMADRALRLFGTDAHNADLAGIRYSAYLPDRCQPWLEAARRQVGAEAAENLLAEGATLNPDEVHAIALGIRAEALKLSGASTHGPRASTV